MSRNLVAVHRSYDYHPHDVQVAFKTVAELHFAPTVFRGIKQKWFRRRLPLHWETVKGGHQKEMQVLAGPMDIQGFGQAVLDGSTISIQAPSHRQGMAEAILLAIQQHLQSSSIYRGKAITSSMTFLDLQAVRMDQLVYNPKVMRDMQAHVWSHIERNAAYTGADMHLPYKVLLSGTFGTGKTAATMWTAQKATEHGWSVFYIEPTADPSIAIVGALEFAHQYQPALVVIEDFDREQREMKSYQTTQLMNALDGASSKTRQLLVLMTTNYPDKIGAGLKRPGRIDKIINMSQFLAGDIEQLLQRSIPAALLDENIHWPAVSEVCKGYAPAFIRGVATSAKLMAISDGPNGRVTQEMIIEAAEDLREQHSACTQETAGFLKS